MLEKIKYCENIAKNLFCWLPYHLWLLLLSKNGLWSSHQLGHLFFFIYQINPKLFYFFIVEIVIFVFIELVKKLFKNLEICFFFSLHRYWPFGFGSSSAWSLVALNRSWILALDVFLSFWRTRSHLCPMINITIWIMPKEVKYIRKAPNKKV